MTQGPQQFRTRLTIAATCIAVGLLIWFGYAAIRAWQRSSEALADNRVKEGTDLLVTALTRDMQGVQRSVLLSPDLADFERDDARNAIDLVASAFARYPYPESFFAWGSPQSTDQVVFYNRRERPPEWATVDGSDSNRFPVAPSHNPALARKLFERISIDAALSRSFSVFEVRLGSRRYQAVARLLYGDALREKLLAVFGFTVNLEWARLNYFPQLTEQVAHVAGTGLHVTLRIVGEGQTPEPESPMTSTAASTRQRRFPMDFFDRLLVSIDQVANLARDFVVVEAVRDDDPSLVAANLGARWLLGLGALAATVVVLGLTLSLRASNTSVKLAELRSDFVSAVSHELKTPVATIRAVGETMLSGRIECTPTQRDYAHLVVQESKRLTRFVNNLLAFSRVTDVADAYRFEHVSLRSVIEETLQEFAFQLTDEGFEVAVDVAPDLPLIVGDGDAIGLVISNLIDNVIRHSGRERWLGIRARASGQSIELQVSDKGAGIPKDEIGSVTRKFYRGRKAASGGSGLGLAIVQRIAAAHGGTVSVHSSPDVGTTVSVIFAQSPKT